MSHDMSEGVWPAERMAEEQRPLTLVAATAAAVQEVEISLAEDRANSQCTGTSRVQVDEKDLVHRGEIRTCSG